MSALPPSPPAERLLRRIRVLGGRLLWAEALAEMTAFLLLVELGLRALPLVRLSRLLGVDLRTRPPAAVPPSAKLELTRPEIRRLRALDTLVRRRRFAAGPCLRRALVGGRVLRRRHPQLVLGVATRATGLEAHAWIEVCGAALGRSEEFLPLVEPAPIAS